MKYTLAGLAKNGSMLSIVWREVGNLQDYVYLGVEVSEHRLYLPGEVLVEVKDE